MVFACYNIGMFRKFIEKYYNFIQWTKKWHFFHILVIIPGILTLWAIIYCCSFYIFDRPTNISFDNNGLDLIFAPFVLGFSEYIMFFIAAGIELIIILIRAIARKPFCVLSNFLSNNKFYNFIYCFFFSLIVLTILEFLLALALIMMSNYIY